MDTRTLPAGEERWGRRRRGSRGPRGRALGVPERRVRGGREAPGLAVRVLLQNEPAASADRVPAADRHGNLPCASRSVLRFRTGE